MHRLHLRIQAQAQMPQQTLLHTQTMEQIQMATLIWVLLHKTLQIPILLLQELAMDTYSWLAQQADQTKATWFLQQAIQVHKIKLFSQQVV